MIVEYFTSGAAPTEGHLATRMPQIVKMYSGASKASKLSATAKMVAKRLVKLKASTAALFLGFAGTDIGDSLIDFTVKNKYFRKALKIASEGAEEVIMAGVDPFIQRMTGIDKDAKAPTSKELKESFGSGVALSLLMGVGTYPIKNAQKKNAVEMINTTIESINPYLLDEKKLTPVTMKSSMEEIEARQGQIKDIALVMSGELQNEVNAAFEVAELVKANNLTDRAVSTVGMRIKSQGEVGSLANLGLSYGKDTKAYQLAERVKDNADVSNAEIGQLAFEVLREYHRELDTLGEEKIISEKAKIAVEKLTNDAKERFKYKADMQKVYNANAEFLSSAKNTVNADFVKGYIDTFAGMIKANNSPMYKALSSNGIDIPTALYDYIATGKIPEGITNTKAFLNAAHTMKNILTESITASVTAHKTIYGENATLDAQLEAIKNGDFSFLAQNEYSHLYDETKVSREFLESVNEEIENAIINIRKGDLDSVPDVIEVTELSPETIKKISDFVGFDISGYKCRIEKDALVHIEKRHGINGEHDQSLSDPKDTARMGYAINHIDNIEWVTDEKGNIVRSRKYNNKDNTSCPVMSLSSRIDGTYCVSQAVPDTKRKTIWVTSARIEKADGGSQVPNGRESTPQPTPKAPLVSSSADNNIPQNEQIVNNNGMQNNENNASEIVTLKQTDNIYSVFEDAKLIYEGADCITDKRVVIPKSDEAIDKIYAVSDALIEVADEYKLARVYDKSNSVLIEGDPKVADDGYIFKIDGKFYACRQKDLDAFNNGKRTIKANTNEKTMWSVHNESGELVAVFMPLKTSSITEDMYNSFPYASEVIAKENSTDETSTKELKSQGENDTIEVDDADGIKYSIESEEITDKGYKKGHSTKIRYNPKGIKLPKAEREKFISSVSTDYYNSNKTHIGLQYQSCVTDKMHILYVYEDGGFGNYNPVARIDFADIDTANAVMEEIRNGTTYRITDLVNRVLQTFEIRRGGYTIYNAYSKKRISSRGNDSLSKGQSKSDTGRIDDGSKGTTRNKRGNESLDNSYSLESEAENEQGNNILNGSEQRDVGKRPGEQTGRVGKSSRRGSEKTIRERQGFLRGLKADQKEEKILTDSEGRKHKFTVVKKSAWNEHMKNLAAFYEAQGVTVEFLDGNVQIAFVGTEKTARGMRNGDTIYVSYNNRRFSPEQIAEHEFVHNKYKTDAVQEAKNKVLERMSEEEYNKAIEKISDAYSGIVNKTALEEELICNILSGMYENSAEYADIVNAYWSKAESDISGYDVSQYAESIDAGGELNESRNAQELGEQGISENNDSVWQRSDDSEGIYERLGTGEKMLYRSQEKGNRHIDWSNGFKSLVAYDSRKAKRAYGILRKISQLNIASQDSDGRKLSKEQMRFFKDTVAKNSKGKLIPLYHATDSMFTEFLFGDFAFHVGTLEQAIDRGKNYIKEVYVNITNPIFIPGDLGYWTTSDVALLLVDEGILGNEQYETIRTLEGFRNSKYGTEANSALINELKKQRYDGIVYKNDFESKGLSFMAFDSNQIKYTSNKNPTTNSELNYSFVDDLNQLFLPAREYAMVSKAIMAKNAGLKESELKPIDYVYAADEFYIYKNNSIGNFDVIDKLDTVVDIDRINALRGVIENGLYGYTDREGLNRLLDDVRSGKRGNTRNNDRIENGRTAMGDDRVLSEQQGSNSVGYSSGIGADKKAVDEVNYSFVDDNEYDFDDFWNEAVETYGAIPEGEKPAREVSVPSYENYTYKTLTEKDDMPITLLALDDVYGEDNKLNRADIIDKGIKNVRQKNNPKNTAENVYVHIPDVGRDVLVTKDGLRHGLTRNAAATARVTMKIGDILENSIRINELMPRKTSAGGYVLLGIAMDENKNYYPCRVVVNNYSTVEEIEVLDVLYAINAKRRTSLQKEQGVVENSTPLIKGSSTISIADLLELVKNDFSDVLTDDVLTNLGVSRKKSTLSDSIKYSKDTAGADSVSRWTTTKRVEGNKESKVNIADIIKGIRDKFGIPVATGKVTDREASGIYRERAETIRTRIANNLPTVSHELGHHLDKKYDLSKLESVNELREVVSEEFLNQYPTEDKNSEAVAEFVRIYLKNTNDANRLCPDFYSDFISTLSKEDLKALNEIASSVNEYLSYNISERYDAAIVSSQKKEKLPFRDRWSELYSNWVDAFHPQKEAIDYVKDVTGQTLSGKDNAYILATNSLNAHTVANFLICDGFRDLNGDIVDAKSFIDSIGMVDSKNVKLLDKYLVLRHSLEWIAPIEEDVTAKRVFADDTLENVEEIKKQITEIEKTHPEIKTAAENLYEYQNNVIKHFVIPAGGMTEDTLLTLNRKYPSYVPFYRAVGKKSGFAKGTFANQRSPIMKAKGSGALIISPTESIIRNTEKMVKFALRNQVMSMWADYADTVDGFGQFMEKVTPDMIPHFTDITQQKEKFADALQQVVSNSKDYFAVSDLFDEIFGDTVTDFTPVANANKKIVTVLKAGRASYYQIHDEAFYESVAELSSQQSKGFLKIMNAIMQPMKLLITQNNPIFAVTNVLRDFGTAYKLSEISNPVTFATQYVKALKDIIANDDSYKQYKAMGGGHSSELSANVENISKTLRRVAEKDMGKARRLAYSIFKHPVATVASINDAVESIPRFAEFKRTLETGGDLQEAIYNASDITTNFKRSGKGDTAKAVNKLIMFNNAAIQGLDKTFRTLTEKDSTKRRATWTKWMLFALVMGIIQNWYNDEVDEEGWKNLSSYKKNNYYNFAIGDGMFLSIPKARETALLDTFTERTIEHLFVGNKEAFYDFGSYLSLQLLPPMIPDTLEPVGAVHSVLGSTIFGGMIDVGFNQDFKGAPIESVYDEFLPSNERYTESTTKLAYGLGQTKVARLLDMSPKKIDHLISSYTGIIGQVNKALFPMNESRKDTSIGLKNKFISDSNYSTDVLNRMYENEEKAKVEFQYSGTAEAAIEYEQNAVITSYISEMNKAIRALSEDKQRNGRAYLLKSLGDWNYENTASQSYIIERFGDGKVSEECLITSVPPSTLEWTKDKVKYSYTMTPQEYEEYVKEYLVLVEKYRAKQSKKSDEDFVTALDATNAAVKKVLNEKYKKKYKDKAQKVKK